MLTQPFGMESFMEYGVLHCSSFKIVFSGVYCKLADSFIQIDFPYTY